MRTPLVYRPTMVVEGLPRALSFDSLDDFRRSAEPMPASMAAAVETGFAGGLLPAGIDCVPRPDGWFAPPAPEGLRTDQLMAALMRAWPGGEQRVLVAWDPERQYHVCSASVDGRVVALVAHPDPVVARAMLLGALHQAEYARSLAAGPDAPSA